VASPPAGLPRELVSGSNVALQSAATCQSCAQAESEESLTSLWACSGVFSTVNIAEVTTDIRFSVSVPVLSEHKTLIVPSVSNVDRLLQSTFSFFSLRATMVKEIVTATGRPNVSQFRLGVPSGMRATLTETMATINPDVDKNSG
jgi:hypothetical protein